MLFWFVISVVEFIFGDNYQLKAFEFSDVFLIPKSSFSVEAWGRFGSAVWVIFSRGENILKILSSVR